MKNKTGGFSLIELLVVVVVVGIISAIAIPNMISSRRNANESSTVSSMRSLHSSQVTYSSSHGGGEFAGNIGGGTLAGLAVLNAVELIDASLASGTKAGYDIVGGREASSPTSPPAFFFSAIPIAPNPIFGTGSYRFGISTDGVLKRDGTLTAQYADTAEAAAAPNIP